MSDQDQRAACDLDAVPRFACALICPGGEREAKRHLAKNMLLQMADELRRLRAEHDELVAARAEIDRQRTQIENLFQTAYAKQAKIDALMLEFCPGEMSQEQRDEWAKHQIANEATK